MNFKTRLLSGTMISLCMLSAGAAHAGVAAADDAANTIRNSDDIIVTATPVNQATPITSSLSTFEPQSIISRTIIEDSVPATSDFSDVILLTPGASGTSNGNGPGLSESKTVLRGFQDGQYNITYDGIPFGDSNDPTHHSTAYFPNGTYERVIVDRGPGHATDLGQSSYGGNVHIVSRELDDHFGVEAQGVYGSYNTRLYRGTVQTGELTSLGGLRAIVVGEIKQTDGALTGSGAEMDNLFGKIEIPLGDNAKFSLLSSYNEEIYSQADSNGTTCNLPNISSVGGKYATGNVSQATCDPLSQIGRYGTRFGLVDINNPLFAGTPFPTLRSDFNWTRKTTDFEIARLQVNLTENLSIDSKMYTYFYKNFTYSSGNVTTACTISTASTCSNMSTKILVNGVVTTQAGDIPGYTKLNQYRQWGNVTQVNWTTPIGIAHVGAWYESSSSHRLRYNYDTTKAYAAGVIAYGKFDFPGAANFYNYSQTNNATNVQLNGQPVPLYVNYDENTSWEQIQGFGEFEFKLFDDRLTVTPGIKVGRFTRSINSPIAAQTSRVGINASNTYNPKLPYLTANFMIRPNWSAYAQFAKGFLIPSLSQSLEVTGLNPSAPKTPQPTKTTNYQVGTVYAGNKLNIDLDAYYIQLSNTTTCDPSSTTGCTQSGVPSVYQGIEGGISYLIMPGLTAIANGSINTAKVETDLHQWVSQAPNYTGLLGVVYRSKMFKLSYLHKFTGRQYADAQTGCSAAITISGVACAAGGIQNQVRIDPYSMGTLAGSFLVGPVEVGVTVYNLLNSNPVTKIGGSSTASSAQYFFQPPRSVQAQVKFRF